MIFNASAAYGFEVPTALASNTEELQIRRTSETLRCVWPHRTRQREELVLFRGRDRLHMQLVTLGEGAHDLLDDHFRRGGARGDAEALDALEALPVDVAGALRQHRNRTTLALGDFAQALRVRGIRRADHDQRIDDGRHLLHRKLAVGGGVADVFLVRAVDARKTSLED